MSHKFGVVIHFFESGIVYTVVEIIADVSRSVKVIDAKHVLCQNKFAEWQGEVYSKWTKDVDN